MAAFLDVTIQFVHKDDVFHEISQLHTVGGFGIIVEVHCSAFGPATTSCCLLPSYGGSHATIWISGHQHTTAKQFNFQGAAMLEALSSLRLCYTSLMNVDAKR